MFWIPRTAQEVKARFAKPELVGSIFDLVDGVFWVGNVLDFSGHIVRTDYFI